MAHEILTPKSVHPTRGYSHAARVGDLLFVAGQVAQDLEGRLVGAADFEAQAGQTFQNLTRILDEAGGRLSNIVKMTTYLTRAGDIETFRAVRNTLFTEPMPPNTLVVVESLANPDFLIEIEAVAALG